MKKFSFKTGIVALSLATVMVAGVVSAASWKFEGYDTENFPGKNKAILINNDVNLYINGIASKVNAKEFNGKLMLPLRSLCEALGMTVGWVGEARLITVEKLPVYITFSPDADGYTFAKTAPMLLGTAPVLENGITYVPTEFVEVILGAKYSVDEEGVVDVTTEEIVEEASAVNEAVLTVAGEKEITLYDFNLGEVVVNITDETVITDSEGNALGAEDIPEGTLVEIKYADFMTMSLPPITNAVEIKAVTGELYEMVNETVIAVETTEEGYTAITVGNKENPVEQTIFNVAENTKIVAADGTQTDITAVKEGTGIVAAASMMATRSIPAQRNVYFVRLAQ